MVFKVIRNMFREFINFIGGVRQAVLEESVSALELEYVELEVAFLTLVMGSLVGLRRYLRYLA